MDNPDLDFPIPNVYDRNNRDLTVFPEGELLTLCGRIDTQLQHKYQFSKQVFDAVMAIEGFVDEGLLSANELALMGHAICSYINICLEQNTPWAALSLFPPTLDPHAEIVLENEKYMRAISAFSRRHKLAAIQELSRILVEVMDSPRLVTIFGPMYSFKSGRSVSLGSELKQHLGIDNVHILISANMKEDTVRSRSLRGEEIVAKKVSLDELAGVADKIIARDIQDESFPVAQVVIIEEATFFAGDAQGANLFVQSVRKLLDHDISVILTGLNTNYRSENLPITTAVGDAIDLPRTNVDCTSFSIVTGNGRIIHEAELTARYNLAIGGLYDFPFPIVAPRDETIGILEYYPIPRDLHPMRALRENDPVLFGLVNQLANEKFMETLIVKKAANEI